MGEITTSSVTGFDPATHLVAADISVDSLQTSSMVLVPLKQSKTDQLGKTVDVIIGQNTFVQWR